MLERGSFRFSSIIVSLGVSFACDVDNSSKKEKFTFAFACSPPSKHTTYSSFSRFNVFIFSFSIILWLDIIDDGTGWKGKELSSFMLVHMLSSRTGKEMIEVKVEMTRKIWWRKKRRREKEREKLVFKDYMGECSYDDNDDGDDISDVLREIKRGRYCDEEIDIFNVRHSVVARSHREFDIFRLSILFLP